jgi:putative PIN family toxin of toxin-antitoxin system
VIQEENKVEKPGAVFDCMVYLQAVVSTRGPAAEALRFLETGRISLFVSDQILAELRDVLTRSKLRRQKRSLTDERIRAFFQLLSGKAVLVQDVPKQFTYARDPDDEPYVNLALVAGARYLVTRDKDLLELMNDESFRTRFPGLMILDPVAFLQEISPR